MYVKTYSRDYANALDAMLLEQYRDAANLASAHKGNRSKFDAIVKVGVPTVDAIFERGLL